MDMLEKTEDNPLGLPPEAGQAVTELGIEIPGAAGGFQDPLSVDESLLDVLAPIEQGDTVYVVMQLSKLKWRFQPAKDHDGLKRVDIFKVDGVAVIDSDFAVEAIDDQRDRVRIAKEKAQGVEHMFGRDGEVNPLAAVPD